MKATMTLAVCGLPLLAALECPVLPAQTEDAKPVSIPSELTIHTCDSLKDPKVFADDPSLRMLVWKNCLEDDKHIQEFMDKQLVKKADVYKGQLAIVAKPSVRRAETFLLKRLDIYVLTSSPWKYQYSLTTSCGKWNKTSAGSVEGSDASPTSKVLGKPSFSLDVVPPCNLYDTSLELSQVRDSTGKEYPVQSEPKSASVVPGVSDEEMAQRLRSLQGSAREPSVPIDTTTKAQGAAAFDARIQDLMVENLTEKYYRVVDVYKGQLMIAVKPPSYAVENGTGSIRRLEVMVINESPETRRLKFRLSCGSWSREEQVSIGPMTKYDFGEVTPIGQPLLVYKPGLDCTIYNLEIDMLGRDVQ